MFVRITRRLAFDDSLQIRVRKLFFRILNPAMKVFYQFLILLFFFFVVPGYCTGNDVSDSGDRYANKGYVGADDIAAAEDIVTDATQRDTDATPSGDGAHNGKRFSTYHFVRAFALSASILSLVSVFFLPNAQDEPRR
jgi:hypothetical protein